MRVFIFLTTLVLQFPLYAQSPKADTPEVKIRGIVFHVEVARTADQWRQGLMYREHLGLHEGMLFFGNRDEVHTFWMKNTLIPLDMVFISSDLKIAHISKHATPLSESPISSVIPVRHVLEIKAGEVDSAHLKEGDRVQFTHIP